MLACGCRQPSSSSAAASSTASCEPGRLASAPPRSRVSVSGPDPRLARDVHLRPTSHRRITMDRGMDFLKSQINNAVMQHNTFLENLQDHEGQAEDVRFRDLCSKYIPAVREHQRMLEEYQQQIGAELGA